MTFDKIFTRVIKTEPEIHFFRNTFTKVNVREQNMRELAPHKIVLKVIITLSQKTKSLHKVV